MTGKHTASSGPPGPTAWTAPDGHLGFGAVRALLDELGDAVVLCSADGVVELVTNAAHDLVPGLRAGQTVEQPHTGPLGDAATAGSGYFHGLHHGRELRGRRHEVDDGRIAWCLSEITTQRPPPGPSPADFLATAGSRLSASLNLRRCAVTTAELAAGAIADMAVVVLPPERRRIPWIRAVGGEPGVHEDVTTTARVAEVPGLGEALAGFPPVPSRWLDPAQAPSWLLPEGFGEPGALLVVPLPGNGVAAGALVLARRADRSPFDEDEELLTRVFAARAGAAISAAALYREQLETADALQNHLLPPQDPRIDGVRIGASYWPARDALRVGGDFYDVFPSEGPGSTAMVALGDVCGKGAHAAVLTGKVRQSLRTLRLLERSPERLLALLNQAMLPPVRERFTTMVLADVAPAEHGRVHMRIASGGHPPPLILRRDGRVEEVGLRGMMIGAVADIRVDVTDIVLAAGETCLLYSDGATEARGGPMGREFYGEERLRAALATCVGMPAHALVERLEQVIGDWLRGNEHDDIALLAVQSPERARLSLARPPNGEERHE
ncbi:Serine phosphatase RsbU, regulator of sigma subunit [Marinactinospora thermotolerans DSM 45154]|uniref:Serine phosphatase RsbU, regulator of sigma subunit n=1 Tax=Marinactinospora thermotolerans DSM 45154 TaxID=1122192 RepID=A0A1T4T2Q5_9ACTN|nr:PP2C family protein-serine/threonine phosphatase [Marinactinospora thermotolerans]SKA34687.1 Serine phosphatase RsbU, regulator of sigma subunit [Marinactinospora thermotolerans DSM 45154]